MTIGNSIIKSINKPATRGLLKSIIYWRYKQRGKEIDLVDFHEEFDAWEFRIAGVSYLGSGPGWVYDQDYLYEQLKQLSGFAYLPKFGDTVVDIGAGVGEETIIFSSLVGPAGKVFAVEAHPKTHKALQYLVRANKLSNVISSNLALSDKAGAVNIEDSDNSLGNSILQVSKTNTFTIQAETFDDFVERNNIQSIDFLKMNVEGAEQLIVKGMVKSLNRIKHLAISCHDFRFRQGESEFFKTKQIVIDFLASNHFKISTQNSTVSMVDDYVYGINPDLI
jgi:FkbM family methyltransferase